MENLFSLKKEKEKNFRRFYLILLFSLVLLLYYFWVPLRSTRFTYSLVSITLSSRFLWIFFQTVTILGSEGFFLVFFALIYWFVDERLGFLGLFIMPLSIFLTSEVPKDIIRLPRPAVRGVAFPTYTFPSGHTSGAVCMWGFLAILMKKTWFWFLALALIFFVGLSRIMLGYHFPGDVLGGIATGMAFLYLFMYLWFYFNPGRKNKSRTFIIFSTISIALPLGISFLPVTYGPNLMGYLTGSLVGYRLARERLSLNLRGDPFQVFLKGLSGLLVLAFLLLGLNYLIPSPHHFFTFIQYGMATFWITFLAPYLFYQSKKIGI